MEYFSSSLESPLKDNFRTFRMAYYVPSIKSWNTHADMDFFSVRCLVRLCMDLSRPFMIQHLETGDTVRLLPQDLKDDYGSLLLNLFFNRLTDRNGSDTDP